MPDHGSLKEIINLPALTIDELRKTTEGNIRDFMLMTCWALALTDEDLHSAETEKIYFFAEALGINEKD